jgi:hypothetical protein
MRSLYIGIINKSPRLISNQYNSKRPEKKNNWGVKMKKILEKKKKKRKPKFAVIPLRGHNESLSPLNFLYIYNQNN